MLNTSELNLKKTFSKIPGNFMNSSVFRYLMIHCKAWGV